MRRFFSVCLVLGGAAAGGVFPGAWLAFALAAGSGLGGSAAEILCLAANLMLGVGGAFYGSLAARAISSGMSWRHNILLPAASGLLFGIAGYLWLDWAISHADPPL